MACAGRWSGIEQTKLGGVRLRNRRLRFRLITRPSTASAEPCETSDLAFLPHSENETFLASGNKAPREEKPCGSNRRPLPCQISDAIWELMRSSERNKFGETEVRVFERRCWLDQPFDDIIVSNWGLQLPRVAPRSIGKLKVNTEPFAFWLTTSIVPPWASTIAFAIGKPIPVPGVRCR